MFRSFAPDELIATRFAVAFPERSRRDGTDMIAEYDASNTLQRRFVHGPGKDEPLVEYDGSGTATKRWLHADERGSIIAISDSGGNLTAINRYDEYGKPQTTNAGRFQYTGQMWLSELGAYYYKARIYAPHLGRFLQTDPIGYADSPNLYAYVLNDPVNLSDPLGLTVLCDGRPAEVCGQRRPIDPVLTTGALFATAFFERFTERLDAGGGQCNPAQNTSGCAPIVVKGKPKPPPRVPSNNSSTIALRSQAGRGDLPARNFCGAEGGAEYPPGTWNNACRGHDACYANQSWRLACDGRFAIDVYIGCLELGSPVSCLAPAIIYGGSVAVFGRDAYRKSGRKRH